MHVFSTIVFLKATAEQISEAKRAVAKALGSAAVGTSEKELTAIRDKALGPIYPAIERREAEQLQKEREAREAQARRKELEANVSRRV